jgi:hypothetical protein
LLKYGTEKTEKYCVVAFLYIISLAIAAASVSALGAAFSINGLSKLFSGASLAITLMASALEFSKFVVAAFLHRTWPHLNKFYRTYLLVSVIVLSVITSMGIFGFLSDAYQTSSVDLESNQIKIDAMKAEQLRNTNEIARINKAIDEIPASRISKKILARKESEPLIRELDKKTETLADQIKGMDLKILDVKTKVGPLIYVARAFHQDIDSIVKWLILIFVSVFDPLAICLVIATSEALKLKSMGLLHTFAFKKDELEAKEADAVHTIQVAHTIQAAAQAEPVIQAVAQAVAAKEESVLAVAARGEAVPSVFAKAAPTMEPKVEPQPGPKQEPKLAPAPEQSSEPDELIHMRFVDDPKSKAS